MTGLSRLPFSPKALVAALVLSVVLAQEPAEMGNQGIVAAVAPVYPPLAAQGHISGRVAVDVTLKETGTVASGSIVEGHPLLSSAALWAAERWTFPPGWRGRRVRLQFVFTLLPTKADPKELTSIFRPPYEVESRARLPQPVVNYDGAKPSESDRPVGKKR